MPGLQLHVRVKRDPSEVLHDQVNMVVRLDHVPDFNNVGMVEHLQDLDFPPERFFSRHLLDLVLLVNFNSDLLIERLVDRDPHRGVRALSDDLADEIVFFETGSKVLLLFFGEKEVNKFLILFCSGGRHAGEEFVSLIIDFKELD